MTQRQKKINALIQQDLAEILLEALRKEGVRNLVLTVTQVRTSVDLSVAKVYLSIFPFKESQSVLEGVKSNLGAIKNTLGGRVRHQLRLVPDLLFLLDDSLHHIEGIEKSLKDRDNPLDAL